MPQLLPSFDRLDALFEYNPLNGLLTYKISGEPAGTPNSAGYLVVSVDGTKHYVHHIAYVLFHRRRFRHGSVSHKNRIVTDNRALNLRLKKRRPVSSRL